MVKYKYMNKLAEVARSMELSLAVHSPSGSESLIDDRRRQLAALPSIVERHVAMGIDGFVQGHPRPAKMALNGLAKAIAGLTYVGNGAMSSVYKDHGSVLKVYRHTATMEDRQREKFMHERDDMSRDLKGVMGVMVAGQTFGIETHPFGTYPVVVARQPYISGGSLDLVASNTTYVNKREIEAYCERQPEGLDRLKKLVGYIFEADDESGLVPDINGVDNFRLTGEAEDIVLIDAEPISAQEHPAVHDMILHQADALDWFLRVA